MFNDDQRAEMRELAQLPPEAKCACRWYRRGDCPSCAPEAGGIVRCGVEQPLAPYLPPWSRRLACVGKRGHVGDHFAWPKGQTSGSHVVWPSEPGDGR